MDKILTMECQSASLRTLLTMVRVQWIKFLEWIVRIFLIELL